MYINNFFWFKPLGNTVSKWRIQKSSCYIPPVIIRLPPFINHLKHLQINLKVLLKTKVKQFYCTKFVIATVKGFRLVRKMQECTTEFSKKQPYRQSLRKYRFTREYRSWREYRLWHVFTSLLTTHFTKGCFKKDEKVLLKDFECSIF